MSMQGGRERAGDDAGNRRLARPRGAGHDHDRLVADLCHRDQLDAEGRKASRPPPSPSLRAG